MGGERSRILDEIERQKEEIAKRKEKTNNYAKYVKEMYWPKVSDIKKQELAVIKETLSARGHVTKSQNFGREDIRSLRERKNTGHQKDRSGIIHRD
jgi:hypothetical protein